jgi:Flp pilus assembly protein TadB
MALKESIQEMEQKAETLLVDRPIWVFWLVYSGVTAVLFGIFYAITALVASRWWITLLVIVAIGLVWGSMTFSRSKTHRKQKPQGKAGSEENSYTDESE